MVCHEPFFILYLLAPPGGAVFLIKAQRDTDSLSSCRLDLLPFYSRLVATLHPCMSDVAEDLCSMLKGDFRFHVSPLWFCSLTHGRSDRLK